MSGIALAFAVLHIDNSPTVLGWVVAAWTAPMVAFMLLGGALADRLPRALVLRGCNFVEGACQLTAAVLVLTGTAQIWHLIILQFVSGTAVSVSYPAFHGMVPVLLPEHERKAAYLLLGQAQSALSILGPALAGILVALSSPGWALAIDAATYLVAGIFLMFLRLPAHSRPERQSSVVADFRVGWQHARALGWVLPVALCSLAYNAISSGAINVLGPVIATETVGADGWGFARAAQAAGIFAFAFVLAKITLHRPLIACQYGFLATAAPMVVLAVWPHTLPLTGAFLIAGCGLAVINLAWSLTVQEKVPEAMLSRIMAIDGFFSFVAMPIGQLLAGPFAHRFGVQEVELGAAALVVVTFLVALAQPSLRALTLRGSPTTDAHADTRDATN